VTTLPHPLANLTGASIVSLLDEDRTNEHGSPDPNRYFHYSKEDVMAAPDLVGRPIAYYPWITVLLTDHVGAGIVLCQLLYWTGRGRDPDDWIYKTNAELGAECGLTRHELLSAKRRLVELELVFVEYRDWPRRTYYRVNMDRIYDQLRAYAREKE
jgi:hypothetical protein